MAWPQLIGSRTPAMDRATLLPVLLLVLAQFAVSQDYQDITATSTNTTTANETIASATPTSPAATEFCKTGNETLGPGALAPLLGLVRGLRTNGKSCSLEKACGDIDCCMEKEGVEGGTCEFGEMPIYIGVGLGSLILISLLICCCCVCCPSKK